MRIPPSVIKKVAEAADKTVRRAGDEFFKRNDAEIKFGAGVATGIAAAKLSTVKGPENNTYRYYPGSSW